MRAQFLLCHTLLKINSKSASRQQSLTLAWPFTNDNEFAFSVITVHPPIEGFFCRS